MWTFVKNGKYNKKKDKKTPKNQNKTKKEKTKKQQNNVKLKT